MDIRIGQKWVYHGSKPGSFCEYGIITSINPFKVQWVDIQHPRKWESDYDSTQSFLKSIEDNYRPSELDTISNVLKNYET